MNDLLADLVLFIIPILVGLAWSFGNRKTYFDESELQSAEDFLHLPQLRLDDIRVLLGEFGQTAGWSSGEHRLAARMVLNQIEGEFSRLEQLLNAAAKFLPEITLRGELLRVAIGLRFRMECRFARLLLAFGGNPLRSIRLAGIQLERLARCASQFAVTFGTGPQARVSTS